jgi:hypothetical protein
MGLCAVQFKALAKRFEVSDDETLVDTHGLLSALFDSPSEGGGGGKSKDPLEEVLAKIRAALKKEGRRLSALRPKLERADER